MNHYTILNLTSPLEKHQSGKLLNQEDIKQAYRLALLTHHPDKKIKSTPTIPNASSEKPSIDAIKLAFTILSDPQTRATYDRELILRTSDNNGDRKAAVTDAGRVFRTGEELVDLDDMVFDDESEIWYRACRCGEQRGYAVTEAQLEEEERKGGREVVVGCGGCSLWLRVAFGVSEEHVEREG